MTGVRRTRDHSMSSQGTRVKFESALSAGRSGFEAARYSQPLYLG